MEALREEEMKVQALQDWIAGQEFGEEGRSGGLSGDSFA